MENLQSSTHYTQKVDPISLEGLDDFLDGLLDRVFDPSLETTSNVRALRTGEQVKPSVDTADSDVSVDDLFESDDIVSDGPGLFSPSYGSKTLSKKTSLFEADPDQTVELELKIRFLEAQLEYRNKELRDSFNRLRFMEGQIKAKDDQIRLIPELIKRGADATRYECELENLKDKLQELSEDLEYAQSSMEKMKSNWLGKLSLWLTKAEKPGN